MGDGRFPVRIDHKYGSTEIPAEPRRVVTVGFVEQDPLLVLGVVPVATTEWFGKHPGAIHPWARDALGDATLPEVLSFENGIQTGEGGIFYAYPPPDAGGRFLADLGFQVPAPIVELAGDQALAEISAERLDLLDTDLLVWLVTQSQRDEVVANDLYTRLDVALQGRDDFLVDEEDVLYGAASSFQGVLSLPLLLDELVPRLTAALDGDPATSAEPR